MVDEDAGLGGAEPQDDFLARLNVGQLAAPHRPGRGVEVDVVIEAAALWVLQGQLHIVPLMDDDQRSGDGAVERHRLNLGAVVVDDHGLLFDDQTHLDHFRRANRFLIVGRNEWRWDELLMHVFQKIDIHGFVACGASGGTIRFLLEMSPLDVERIGRGAHGAREHRRRTDSRGRGKKLSAGKTGHLSISCTDVVRLHCVFYACWQEAALIWVKLRPRRSWGGSRPPPVSLVVAEFPVVAGARTHWPPYPYAGIPLSVLQSLGTVFDKTFYLLVDQHPRVVAFGVSGLS